MQKWLEFLIIICDHYGIDDKRKEKKKNEKIWDGVSYVYFNNVNEKAYVTFLKNACFRKSSIVIEKGSKFLIHERKEHSFFFSKGHVCVCVLVFSCYQRGKFQRVNCSSLHLCTLVSM